MIGRVFLGRYEAVRLLGEGGMGRVYLARQLDLGRQVVVKVMHERVAADSKFRDRFQRETLLMARFQHPYAVTLYDASLNDPEGPCIVMEYVRGITLDTLLLRNGRLTPPRVGRLLEQLCEVLQAAHAEGIVHRDLKPANLMVVDADTPYEKIKVMDFGLAKLVGSDHGMKITDANAEFAIGTPGYICPEQVQGEEVDSRGDLYSVGVILYELLTGRLPFTGESTMDVLLGHATETPPSFAERGARDWVPPAIEDVVMACLAKNPAQRPASARELAERYDAALAGERQRQEAPAPAAATARRNTPPPTAPAGLDPSVVVHELDAWMPEQIATYKLRGFITEVGGDVLESGPGLIRVRLGPRSAYRSPGQGPLSWLGLGRRANDVIDLDLHLQRSPSDRDNMLRIRVVLRPSAPEHGLDLAWRNRCDQVYCDLRAYLIGQTGH